MSAKAIYQQSPPCIPALDDVPPEIWSTIIQYAADSGSGLYEYEMTPSEHADFLRGEEMAQMRVYHANFRTRSYLARVNKAWYEMAAPFLFEYIHLENAWKIFPLSKVLLRSKEIPASNGLGRTLGWWTKRLDVYMGESITTGSPDIQATIAQLAQMVTCFPNLRILTFFASAYSDFETVRTSSILDAVSCPKSLKMIYWSKKVFWPSIDAWTAFLERHPGLQSVRGPPDVKTKNQIALHSLEALRTWPSSPSLDHDNMELSACNLPNLLCLSCPQSTPPSDQFLHRVGKQLSIIQVNDFFIFGTTTNHFSSIRRICFNLVQININLFLWRSFDKIYAHALGFPQTVKTLGIRILQDYVLAGEARELLQDAFPLVISNNTSIKTIQFLAQMNVEILRQHPEILMEGVQLLASLGVVLKDHICRGILESES